jgi:hypothetical protein
MCQQIEPYHLTLLHEQLGPRSLLLEVLWTGRSCTHSGRFG